MVVLNNEWFLCFLSSFAGIAMTVLSKNVCDKPLKNGGCLCSTMVGGKLVVHCYGPQLQEIPKDIPENVYRLEISNTNITVLRNESFNGFSNLQMLVIENNRIREIESAALFPLINMSRLSLKNNQLTDLKELQMPVNNKLFLIDLSFNKIQTINRNALRAMKKLNFVILTGNPLHCSCELAHFKEWIEMRRMWFRIQLRDALCVDRNNTPLSDVTTFPNCKGLYKTVRITTKVTLLKEITEGLANEYEAENKKFDQEVRNEMTSTVRRNVPDTGSLQIGIVAVGLPFVTVSVDWVWRTTYDYDAAFLVSAFNKTFRNMKTLAGAKVESDTVEAFETDTNDVCQSSAIGNIKGGFYWPATRTGENATLYCPANVAEIAFRSCFSDGTGATWGAPVTAMCPELYPTTPPTTAEQRGTWNGIDLDNINEVNADAMAEALYELSKNAANLSAEDLERIVVILESLVNLKSSMTQGRRQYLITGVLSNLFDARNQTLVTAEFKYKTSSRYLKITDKIIDNTNISDKDMEIIHSNIGLFAAQVDTKNYSGTAFSAASVLDSLEGQEISLGGHDSSVKGSTTVVIPSTVFDESVPNDHFTSKDRRISLAIYRDSTIIEPIGKARGPRAMMKVAKSSNTKTRVVNSAVLNVRIPGYAVRNLTESIKFRFQPINKNAGNASCGYFVDPEAFVGGWSTKGCQLTAYKPGKYVECSCNHLTNFALLMDVYGVGGKLSVANRKAMSYISYIGCALSLMALLLTLLSYMMFRKLRSNSSSSRGRQRTSNPAKILINLCCAIAASNVVFLLGEQHYSLENSISCKVVAVILHFCLLSAISWMSVEGFYMYKALVQVFNTHFSYFLLKTCLLGYGIPLIIVVITLGISKTSNYGLQPGDICWLSTNAFFGAFLTPVCIMLIFNFIIFFLVMRKLTGNSGKILNKKDKTKTSQRLRRVVTLVFLFGLTWILAVFATDGAGIVFQYLFAISNSLQGVFIFIFNILLNKSAIKEWKRKLFGTEEDASKLTSARYSTVRDTLS